ncbi:MAG: 50S ribosomal protein L6 [Crenarchaeota archaeon]|nr:50S ribosomal protein L6 [Thermoproteota archaeon]MDW8033830.1 50S ribosomal protein L6 [Nitrososphaerota archaeon]
MSISITNSVYSEIVEALEGVKISLNDSIVTVEGPLGKLSKDFSHTGLILILEGRTLRIFSTKKGKRFKAMIGTVAKLVKNMMEGVLHGYMVKLKIVYSHFPVTVKYDKSHSTVYIHNFLGEKSPRCFKVPFKNIDISISGQDITVTGLDKNEVTQVAAMFELATKIKDKDPRVYIDGIYIVEKGLWRR